MSSDLPPERHPGSQQESEGRFVALGRLGGLGLQFGAVVSLFAYLGHWLDERLNTTPLLLIVGVLLGFGGATVSIVAAVNRWRSST